MKTAAPATRTAGRVLVVEDERDVAELIRYNLSREGYDVVVAGSGGDAIKQAREVQPDVVLLDIMVPQVNGWEVCRRLKQDAETRAIPVIMVSSLGSEDSRKRGADAGISAYIVKGEFDQGTFLGVVREWLG